ncbi:MAG: DNA polymerase [Candidatus Wildermuthbacteria bacterium]|nr:DNA polymerase [Candidatus Wildermuthbacteria bacterium]
MPKTKKLLLLIDANSLIHRAFHALPELSNPKGELVNAVYGFLLVLFKALKELQPDYAAACFDAPGPTLREKKYAQYKAKRVKASQELYDQIPKIKEFLAAFHIPSFEKEGFEADDFLGAMAKKTSQKQVHPPLETIILTGDMDMLQLVGERVRVYSLRKGLQDTVMYDEAKVKERFSGLAPSQVIDYKALRGDPSDNIPGVPGVGEKTAEELVGTFQSLENLYEELEANTEKASSLKPRLKEILRQSKDQAFLCKELVTIDQNAPVVFELEDLAWRVFQKEAVLELLNSYGFRSLVPRLEGLGGIFETSPGQQSLEVENRTERIERFFKEELFSKEVYELEKRLIPVLENMERLGIKIDSSYLSGLAKEIGKMLKTLEERIAELAGSPFNINSPRQLSTVLFETLGISKKGIRKTPGGTLSTASPELAKIEQAHPIVKEVLQYREFAKLQNTYLEPLPLLADNTGRIHAHFDQFGAATGRLSSLNPNLQNIPVLGEWGKKVRKGFIAGKGFTLCSFDYSQIELRVASHVAKEEKMQEFFREQKDIHTMTASEVFGIPVKDVKPDMRYRAKALNFGVLYGMGARGFARSAAIPLEEAQMFIENYFLRFPRIADYMEDTIQFAEEHGYVETLLGRKRYIPDITSETPVLKAAAERAAINHPIQGTAADIMKLAMVNVYEAIPEQKARMILQIHDELLFEVPSGTMRKTLEEIREIMEKAFPLEVPLTVDVSTGENWGKLLPFKNK